MPAVSAESLNGVNVALSQSEEKRNKYVTAGNNF
jgi:hypothetical protein